MTKLNLLKLSALGGLLVFGFFFIEYKAQAASYDYTLNIPCDKKGTSGPCGSSTGMGFVSNGNGVNPYQAYRWDYDTKFEGHGGAGPSGGNGGLWICYSLSGAMWDGDCGIEVITGSATMGGDGTRFTGCGTAITCPGGVGDWTAFYRGSKDLGPSTDAYKYIAWQYYANDATFSPATLKVYGRIVEGDILPTTPTTVNVGDNFNIDYLADFALISTDISATSGLNCSSTGNCTAVSAGTSVVTLSVRGPTGDGTRTFTDSITITIDGASAGSPPGPLNITGISCFGWPNPVVETNHTASSGSLSYALEMTTNGGSWTQVFAGSYVQMDQYAEPVTPGNNYQFRVKAINSNGTAYTAPGSPGAIDAANCSASAPPPPPPPPPGPTPPPPPPPGPSCSYNSEFVSQTINGVPYNSATSITLAPSTSYPVSIVMKNLCDDIWPYGSGYHLGSQNPPDNSNFGLYRVPVPSTVLKNQNATFNFTMTTPASGSNNFQWRMVNDSGGPWFGNYTPNILINSGGPGVPVINTYMKITGTPDATYTAGPVTYPIGSPLTLMYSTTNSPTSCTGVGAISGAYPNNPSNVVDLGVYPSNTYGFGINCVNASGAGSNTVWVTISGATTGTIVVTSNNPAGSWEITGPDPMSPISGFGTTATYTVAPGAYTMGNFNIPGHSVSPSPSATQTLTAGGSITYNLSYVLNTGNVSATSTLPTGAWSVTDSSNNIVRYKMGTDPDNFPLPVGNYIFRVLGLPDYVESVRVNGGSVDYPNSYVFTITNGSSISLVGYYQQPPPTAPTDIQQILAPCGQIRISGLDNSTNESGYAIYYRDSAAGPDNFIGTTGSVAGSGNRVRYLWTTPPATPVWMVVMSYIDYGVTRVYSSPVVSSTSYTAQTCYPDLGTSTKQIISVVDSAGNSVAPNAPGKNGYIVTFRITVQNNGTDRLRVNGIDDVFRPNPSADGAPMQLKQPAAGWNLRVDTNADGAWESGYTLTQLAPENVRINLTGVKCTTNNNTDCSPAEDPSCVQSPIPLCNNWVVLFDSEVSTTSLNVKAEGWNEADVFFAYPSGPCPIYTLCSSVGGPQHLRSAKYLINSPLPKVPQFREGSP